MFLNFNGELREEGAALLRADNRGFRYGDGLFETMLVRGGKVRLGAFHLERLAGGMVLLGLALRQPVSLAELEERIVELCALNRIDKEALVRARLTVFRGSAGLSNSPDKEAWYCIEVGQLGGGSVDNEGLDLGIFPLGRKACDSYSAIKSNNYMLSTQAGMYAREHNLHDCALLNSYGRVAETSIANIWWVKEGRLFTPPLSEGCVSGVMRRWLLGSLPAEGFAVEERPVSPEELAGADEIFLSNAIRGVQRVRNFEGHALGCRLAAVIEKEIINKIQ